MKNLRKKGLIALFLILGLLFFLIFVFFFFQTQVFESSLESETQKIVQKTTTFATLHPFIESCFYLTAEDGLRLLGWQGGHIILPEDLLVTSYSFIAYGFDKGENRLNDKKGMEEELSWYVNNHLTSCMGEVTNTVGYSLILEDINTTTMIRDDSVFLTTHLPFVQEENGENKDLRFGVTLPVRLGYLHQTLEEIISLQKEDDEWIPITHLSELDLEVNLHPFSSEVMVYDFIDEQSTLGGEPYKFLMANRFTSNSVEAVIG